MLVFKLNGGLSIEEPEHWAREIPEPPVIQASAAQIQLGGELYGEVCGFCHGIGAYGGLLFQICANERTNTPHVQRDRA